MRKLIFALTFLLFAISMVYSISQKEDTLKYGKTLRLKLIPVDPRSLMQGDYMRLDFALTRQVNKELLKISYKEDKLILTLDSNNIGTFKRFLNKNNSLKSNELILNFTYKKGEKYARSKISTTSYFFEEGYRKKYENAKYGEFKVNTKGEAILTFLLDETFNIIE